MLVKEADEKVSVTWNDITDKGDDEVYDPLFARRGQRAATTR